MLLSATFAAVAPPFAHSADSEGKVLRLSLRQGKLMALEKNLNIEIRRVDVEIEAANIEKALGGFDPEFSSSISYRDTTSPLASRASEAAGGRGVSESRAYGLNTGITGIASRAGTRYRVELDGQRTESNFNRFEGEHEAFIGVRITQPLRQGLHIDATRYNIEVARRNRDISEAALVLEIADTLAGLRQAYWNLVLAVEELKVGKEALGLAESLLDLSQKRLKAGVVPPIEVTQAEAGVASKAEAVILAKKAVRERENSLKRFVSDDVGSFRDVSIIPTDAPPSEPIHVDFEESVRLGLLHRPDYLMLKTEVEKNNLRLSYAEDRLLPTLDLEASYGLNSLSNTLGGSITGLDGNPEWSLGLVLKFPLSNREARAEQQSAHLKQRKLLLGLKDLEQRIFTEVDNALGAIKTGVERIEATLVATRLAREALRAEELKLRAGLSTSHNVLDLQEELSEARSREIRARVDYAKSLVELSAARGTVLRDEGIDYVD